MSTFTIPPELASLLVQFKDATELRDPQGKVIGLFTPLAKAEEEHRERIKALFDMEEVERAMAHGGEGRPLKDILRDLEARGRRE